MQQCPWARLSGLDQVAAGVFYTDSKRDRIMMGELSDMWSKQKQIIASTQADLEMMTNPFAGFGIVSSSSQQPCPSETLQTASVRVIKNLATIAREIEVHVDLARRHRITPAHSEIDQITYYQERYVNKED